MSDSKPLDDLDFNPSPVQNAQGKPKKPMPASKKIKILAALVIAEGIAMGLLVGFWPRTASTSSIPIDESFSINAGASVSPESPDSNFVPVSYVGEMGGDTFHIYESFSLDAISTRLERYTAPTLTSVELHYNVYATNFTWWNISRVIGPWNKNTVTWNTRPATGANLGNLSVEKGDYNNVFYKTINVTSWVTGLLSGGGNISICITPMESIQGIQGSGLQIKGVTNVQAGGSIPGSSPFFVITMATIGIVFVLAQKSRKFKSGGIMPS